MEATTLVNHIVHRLRGVDGLIGIVLGGSRARGTHTPTSDIDLGLFYDPAIPPDLASLRQVASELDDEHRLDVITPLGGWGPWINGGGWLTVQGLPVDFLYRDITKVERIIDDCCAGRIEIAYQPGHPHGFATSIYMAEIAHCQLLWDATGALAALKAKTQPYPRALRRATLDKFQWEIDFSLNVAHKAIPRGDVSYVAGCCFRAVACLAQTLFALNGQYLMNEKGAIALAATLPHTIDNLQPRVESAFATLSADPAALEHSIAILRHIAQECDALVASVTVQE